MLKLICFIRRHPDLSREQFHAHWRDVHGPLFADTPAIRRHILRYEQLPRLEADYARERSGAEVADAGFDGVTMLWYENMAAFEAMAAEPDYLARVVPDEDVLIDRAGSPWMLADRENVIVDPPGAREAAGARLVSLFRRNPALDRDTFQRHWREHHGGLFRDVPELRRDILAYVQNPSAEGSQGPERPWDGVTEQWFESLGRFVESLGEPKQRELVEPDVGYMLDPGGIHFLMCGPPRVVIGDRS